MSGETKESKFVVRATVGFIFLCACLFVGLVVKNNYSIKILPTIVFSLLFLTSVLRDVVLTSDDDVEIGMNTDTAIVAGAAVVFLTVNSPLGFVLALLTTVIYPPNIKTREWSKLILNVSNEVAAGCCSYLFLRSVNFSINESFPTFGLKVLTATSIFVVMNFIFMAIYFVSRKIHWREAMYDLRKSLVEVIPLALFSGLLGKFFFDYGTMMLVMFAVPIFFGRELHASYARMSETQKSTLDTLTRTLEAKDKYTAGHVERVAKFAKYIGEELGYGPKKLERIRQAALLHDAGKLIVPSALLNKPGKLTEDEFKIIQRHEFVTIEILQSIDFLAPIAWVAGGDHNSMEGKDVKNLAPFIVSACDAFDAMTSSRSYRKALSMEVAFEELQTKKGKQFHPKVVEALIRAIESRGEHYGDGYETDIVHADAPEAGIGSAGIGDLEGDNAAAAVKDEISRQARDDGAGVRDDRAGARDDNTQGANNA